MNSNFSMKVHLPLLVFGLVAPFIFPGLQYQIATLWVMVLFALTWDVMGGQMGYNSLGNIFFFGVGMYASAVIQIAQFADVGAFTAARGAVVIEYTDAQYFQGLVLGILCSGFVAAATAFALGWTVFGLRGPYFAIGTLGMALAAGELMGTWEWVGGGSGIAMPVYPGSAEAKGLTFYFLTFAAAVLTFITLQWVYKTRFGLAINAIRDDEEKAEAMGIHTLRYKSVAWAISAFFLGISGALFGNITGFVEPLEVAFPTVTFGIFMVAMTLLGGKGTLWGPVLGAILFHVIKEATWTYFLGWQWVALGMLIIINVVFFQQGIMGWLMEKYPEKFGIVVEDKGAPK
jgi:branched-chain amino acid transport system permease protein